MKGTLATRARIGCLTLLFHASACSDGSGPPPEPPQLMSASPLVQTATAGTAAAGPVVMAAREDGSRVRGIVVNFAVTGGARISTTVDTTDAHGMASPGTWRLSDEPGESTITATSPAVPGASVVFTATGRIGPPARITKTGDGQSTQPGEPVRVLPSITVRDVAGNVVGG